MSWKTFRGVLCLLAVEMGIANVSAAEKIKSAICHDILDFCGRELVTLGWGEIETKMAIIVLAKL